MNAQEDKQWTSQIDSLEALSEIEKEKSKKALIKIKEIFGSSVTSLAERKHPITNYVFGKNHAPWTWKWLIELAESVQLVLNHVNGIKIIDKLKNESTFAEALFQLYIARCIISRDLNIEFLEEDNNRKTVDWKITDSAANDELFVELTELRDESSEQVSLRHKFRTVSDRRVADRRIHAGCLSYSFAVCFTNHIFRDPPFSKYSNK
jgi:hypothetical protein